MLETGVDALILHGHVIDALRSLPERSVHCVVTSPPYWALRKYKGGKQIVWGGKPDCAHQWGEAGEPKANRWGDPATLSKKQASNGGSLECIEGLEGNSGRSCALCGAFLGELGLEPTFHRYIQNLVLVFNEVRRVLRDDGIVALNLGDCFSRNPKKGSAAGFGIHANIGDFVSNTNDAGVAEGNKLLLPHRVAIALMDAGWIVRQDCVWSKRSPMPESVRNRPSTSHEFIFLLAKRGGYYWDQEAVKTSYAESTLPQKGKAYTGQTREGWEESGAQSASDSKRSMVASLDKGTGANMRSVITPDAEAEEFDLTPDSGVNHQVVRRPLSASTFKRESAKEDMVPGKTSLQHRAERPDTYDTGSANMRSVITLSSDPLDSAEVGAGDVQHFAAFPRGLVRPFILAGCPEQCCPHCGAGWVRDTERQVFDRTRDRKIDAGVPHNNPYGTVPGSNTRGMPDPGVVTLGWKPGCKCEHAESDTVPGVAMDIFNGSGTVGEVALCFQRRYIGCEVSADYVRLTQQRLLRRGGGLFREGEIVVREVAG